MSAPRSTASEPEGPRTAAPEPGRLDQPFFLGLSAFLALVLPIFLVMGKSMPVNPAVVLQWVLVVVSGVWLAYVVSLRSLALLQFGVALFTYVWLGLSPLVQLVLRTSPLGFPFPVSVSFGATMLVLAGLVAYIVGSHLPRRRDGAPDAFRRYADRVVVPWKVVLLGVIALLLFAEATNRLGGPGVYFSSRQAARTAGRSAGNGNNAMLAIAYWALSVSVLWTLVGIVALRARRRRHPLLWWCSFALFVLLNITVNNPISQPRYWAGTVLLGGLFLFRWARRRGVFRALALTIVFALIVVFPYADYFRYKDRPVEQSRTVVQQLTTADYDAYAMIESGMQYESAHGLQPRFLVTEMLFFVPRSVWSGKSDYVGAVIATDLNLTNTNRSAPLWIESYLWGGPLTVVVVFLLLGLAHRRLDDALEPRAPDRPWVGRIGSGFVPMLGFFGLILMRGSLLFAMAPLTMLILIPYLISRRTVETAVPETLAVTPAAHRTSAHDGPAAAAASRAIPKQHKEISW